jgi:hypothetical protein
VVDQAAEQSTSIAGAVATRTGRLLDDLLMQEGALPDRRLRRRADLCPASERMSLSSQSGSVGAPTGRRASTAERLTREAQNRQAASANSASFTKIGVFTRSANATASEGRAETTMGTPSRSVSSI